MPAFADGHRRESGGPWFRREKGIADNMPAEKEAARDIKGGIVKRSEVRHGSVCIMCGKPSKQRICESCKVKVEAEAIHQKLEAIKPDKQPD